MTQSLLLIHPPLVKPSEPPAGPARLAGALKRHDIPCTLVDANIEGLLYLLARKVAGDNGHQGSDDTWTKRSCRHLEMHLSFLRSPDGYRNMDRYKRAVLDINRVLARAIPAENAVRLSLSDYEDRRRSPLRSRDLIAAAKMPEDNPFHAYFRERLPALLDQAQPSWAGFSLNYLSQALCCFAMIGFLRRICPAIKIVLGGGLVTSWMQRPDWRNPFQGLVDEWVAGPGEGPLLALLGVAHDGLPETPDYSAFPAAHYLSPGFILPYSASSGCYWRRCAFCPEKAEANPYRPAPDDRVISELTQGEKPTLIHLLDNAIRPSLLTRMAIRPPGAPWYGFARISKELTDPDFCVALKRAGCVMLKLGIESGSQKVLDALDKGIDLETTGKVLKALHQAGIAAYVYLLFGTPAETEKDAFQTLDFVIRYREL